MQGFVLSTFLTFSKEYLRRGGIESPLLEWEESVYSLERCYPSRTLIEEALKLSREASRPADSLLKEFGAYLAPRVLSASPRMIPSHWNPIDLLQHADEFEGHLIGLLLTGGEKRGSIKCERLGPWKICLRLFKQPPFWTLREGALEALSIAFESPLTIQELTPLQSDLYRESIYEIAPSEVLMRATVT